MCVCACVHAHEEETQLLEKLGNLAEVEEMKECKESQALGKHSFRNSIKIHTCVLEHLQ